MRTSAPQERDTAAFGVHEIRLTLRQWICALGVVLTAATAVPLLWNRLEHIQIGPDYRIPYDLSGDYWLYRRRVEAIPANVIPIVGDSVVWGEYVRPDGTLSHFLNQRSGRTTFANCGLNGVFPLALDGLIDHYGAALQHRRVIVHCNLLWMSSPKADLSSPEEQTINHAKLIPQFERIPAYRADTAVRLGNAAERSVGLLQWVNHIDSAYFDRVSIPEWTLKQTTSEPPEPSHAWQNPAAQITMHTPAEPAVDRQRGPDSRRHHAWNLHGDSPTTFDWTPLNRSLQWRGFRRTLQRLKDRGCSVLVIVGPFNEWMITPDQRSEFARLRDEAAAGIRADGAVCLVPRPLPDGLYADASHPLTAGYAELADRLYRSPEFVHWITGP